VRREPPKERDLKKKKKHQRKDLLGKKPIVSCRTGEENKGGGNEKFLRAKTASPRRKATPGFRQKEGAVHLTRKARQKKEKDTGGRKKKQGNTPPREKGSQKGWGKGDCIALQKEEETTKKGGRLQQKKATCRLRFKRGPKSEGGKSIIFEDVVTGKFPQKKKMTRHTLWEENSAMYSLDFKRSSGGGKSAKPSSAEETEAH